MTADKDIENRLCHAVQQGIPLEPRPFAVLGERFGLTEDAVTDQLRRWREDGILREISAVLEGSALGYESSLVACRVPAADVERVAAIIDQHPTVTHDYLRDHRYNLWFTLAVPRTMGLEPTLRLLERATGVGPMHLLRRTHTFKIGVNFDLRSRENTTTVKALVEPAPLACTDREIRMLRALQRPLEYVAEPFEAGARQAGVAVDELLGFARANLGGAIRRVCGTLRHRRAGVAGNAMTVWRAPAAALAELGPRLAAHPEISHCYARNAVADFPYTLYGMLHGPDRATCRSTAARIAADLGLDDYLALFSVHEFKKCRLRYFLPELDAWWLRHANEEAA